MRKNLIRLPATEIAFCLVTLEPECDIRSTEREDCNADLKAPFVTPEECLNAGCCYDDMFMSERSVKFYGEEGRKWCFVAKGGMCLFSELQDERKFLVAVKNLKNLKVLEWN